MALQHAPEEGSAFSLARFTLSVGPGHTIGIKAALTSPVSTGDERRGPTYQERSASPRTAILEREERRGLASNSQFFHSLVLSEAGWALAMPDSEVFQSHEGVTSSETASNIVVERVWLARKIGVLNNGTIMPIRHL